MSPQTIDSGIKGGVRITPCHALPAFSAMLVCEVSLKFKNVQCTASFNARGAMIKISQLTDDEKRRGMIAIFPSNRCVAGQALH